MVLFCSDADPGFFQTTLLNYPKVPLLSLVHGFSHGRDAPHGPWSCHQSIRISPVGDDHDTMARPELDRPDAYQDFDSLLRRLLGSCWDTGDFFV